MEVEIRAKCDHEDVMKRLVGLGFEFTEKKSQDDCYYKKRGEEKATQRAGSWIVRVRHEGDKAELCMKVLTETTGSWEEYETIVSDSESVKEILDRIGLVKVLELNKTRIEARKDGMAVCIDDVKQLGSYIEAEVQTDRVEDGKKRISGLFQSIGITKDDHEHRGYPVIIFEAQGIKFDGTG